MKNNLITKAIILTLVITSSMLISCNTVNQYKYNSIDKKFSKDINEFNLNYNENKSEIDYTKFIKIEMRESEPLFNKTTEQQTIDNDLCNLIYEYRIENISDKPISINYKIFFPNEITESVVVTNASAIDPKSKDIILEPTKGVSGNIGALMIHTNKLNEEQKKIYEKYKDTLCFEIHINGKKAYVRDSYENK